MLRTGPMITAGRGTPQGLFLGFCKKHNPYEKEDEVCDTIYKVMVDQLSVQSDLEFATASC